MVQRFVVVLLVMMVVFVGCGEDEPEKAKPKEVLKEVVDEGPARIIWKKDVIMVLIPANWQQRFFEMGPNDGPDEEKPVHTVELDDFYMDKYEVTVGRFKKFLAADPHYIFEPDRWHKIDEYSPTSKHPMIHVSWYDADNYAKWAGKRLPTPAEWSYAARGGLVGKKFPWGDDEAVARDYANFQGVLGRDQWYRTAPVGSFRPNGYGLHDMAGNVWEWCEGLYTEREDGDRCLQGGSWPDGTDYLHVATWNFAWGYEYGTVGFRCVADVEE